MAAGEFLALFGYQAEEAAFFGQHFVHAHAEAGLDLLAGLVEHMPQDLHVAVRAQVAHLGVQQVEVMPEAGRFQVGAGGGIEPRLGPA